MDLEKGSQESAVLPETFFFSFGGVSMFLQDHTHNVCTHISLSHPIGQPCIAFQGI